MLQKWSLSEWTSGHLVNRRKTAVMTHHRPSREAQAEALTQSEGWVAQSLPAPKSHPSPTIGNGPLSKAWPSQWRWCRKLLLGGNTLTHICYPDCSLRKLAGREWGTGLASFDLVQQVK